MTPRRIPDVLTKVEFQRVLEKTYKEHHKMAFLLGYLSGLRVGEIVRLRPENIDRGRQLLIIRQSKNKKDRLVPYKRAMVKYFSQLPLQVTARALQIAFLKACARAGVKKDYLKFHCLRHSFATNYVNAGGSYKNLQLILGHSSVAITLDVYTHVATQTIQDEYAELVGK